jgi:hypothetical protein
MAVGPCMHTTLDKPDGLSNEEGFLELECWKISPEASARA